MTVIVLKYLSTTQTTNNEIDCNLCVRIGQLLCRPDHTERHMSWC